MTEGTAVASIGTTDTMGQCSHEEADTRIIVHLIHALKLGGRRIQVRTVDTDVVVILIGVFLDIAATYPTADVWVAFGMGNNHKLFHINTICETLGEQRSKSLPIFHAFSGCDTTSSFNGKGKKSAWQAWNVFPEITDTFVHLADYPFHNVDNDNFHFKNLERFTVVLYDKTSDLESVNECRRVLFCQMNRSMDRLPPTRDALLQHCKRAIYQASVWTTCREPQPLLPSPQEFAWTKIGESWEPTWMTIPEVSKTCRELIKCKCKGECTTCKCAKANVMCSPLCKCKCTK